jgi:hypothetical protein
MNEGKIGRIRLRQVQNVNATSLQGAPMSQSRGHRVASLLKRWCLGTHQGGISKEHLDYCLDEFTFRFYAQHSVMRSRPHQILQWHGFRHFGTPHNQ